MESPVSVNSNLRAAKRRIKTKDPGERGHPSQKLPVFRCSLPIGPEPKTANHRAQRPVAETKDVRRMHKPTEHVFSGLALAGLNLGRLRPKLTKVRV